MSKNKSLSDWSEPSDSSDVLDADSIKDTAKLVEAEGKEIGSVSLKVYWNYIKHIGAWPMLSALVVLFINRGFYFAAEWWIAIWASTDFKEQEDMKWIWVLISLTGAGVVTSLSLFVLFGLFVMGSTRLHQQMIQRVMHAPLRFFHTNPTGRILNRFSKDMGLQDEDLPWIGVDVLAVSAAFHFSLNLFVQNLSLVFGTFVLVSIALPYMLIFFLLITWVFWRVRTRYVITSREIKRYDGVTRSPVYAMLSANIKGLATIRAYGSEDEFQDRFLEALDLNGTWWTAFLSTSRWVGFRMDAISACVMLFSVILAISLGKQVTLFSSRW